MKELKVIQQRECTSHSAQTWRGTCYVEGTRGPGRVRAGTILGTGDGAMNKAHKCLPTEVRHTFFLRKDESSVLNS